MKSSCVESDALWKVGQEKLAPWYRSVSSHRPNPPLQSRKKISILMPDLSNVLLSDNRYRNLG